MRYSLGIVCSVLIGCVFSLCDMPELVSFDGPFLPSPYTDALQYTMHMWSDIRVAKDLYKDDYITWIYAILGQLTCLDHTVNKCDALIATDDLAYLARVIEMVKQEAMALQCIPVPAEVMQQLFESIEAKIMSLLNNSQ